MLTGGCFCGQVRYEVSAPVADSTVCHCVDCRRVAGAAFVPWFTVERAGFRFVRGEPRMLASSAKVVRAFCPACGTHLTYQSADFPDEIDISTCSLDAPERVPPRHHTWTAQKLPWVNLSDGLPQYRGGDSSGG
ncbi:GFA family protein [Trinickia terrae]|uniref:GFA family protein n=1 Tax=Trinickia terrae TaxID=2571161 RepID=A0A4U1I7W6_9BURK|nr:GFA family protein [Trinickia terrae]TKC89345.1 GFA family protein [Trinickia terrae]